MVKDMNMEDENEKISNVPSIILVNQSLNHEPTMSFQSTSRKRTKLEGDMVKRFSEIAS